ncbi:MAG: hypothetical protein JWR30_2191 [Conexibacter sp.]|jgi:hypothetical protein|nr:hypothetical protein [Conexibacter sp.]MCZ4494833.1 hypothetical protein [Conexibacter sp.]MDX6715461.1 hypothetical protein [Baekduia sp.]MDX6731553.1 hypothetical protein [Baekduia sp.]
MSHGHPPIDHLRTINTARLELESAGNPSYVVLTLDAAGEGHLSPVVFSTVGPAADHGMRVARTLAPSEQLVIVSRSAGADRAMFTILDPKTMKRIHQRVEVVEQTFAETDAAI